MNLLRLILIIVAVWIVVFMVRQYLRRNSESTTQMRSGNMVRCDHCGLHVPESESVKVGNRHYCSIEHKKAADKG